MIGPCVLLHDGFARLKGIVHDAVRGVDSEDLAWRPGPEANCLGWLVWHLARVQDSQIAALAGSEQVWILEDWAERFDLPFDPSATGYGQSSDEAAALRTTPDLLAGYYDAVQARTLSYLDHVGALPDQLERVVDERWDPPVTEAVRLVSILADDLQHAGQAAYVRGLLDHR